MLALDLLDYPACLSSPLRPPVSAGDSASLPVLMFLMEFLRPEIAVELGTDDGATYCAGCQAVSASRLRTRCFGFGRAAEHFAELKSYHDPLYAGFSQLAASDPAEALTTFADATIDFLQFRGVRSEDLKRTFEDWLPKVKKEGVVLFHRLNGENSLRYLWEELRTFYTHFEWPGETGLVMIWPGGGETSPPGRMDLLAANAARLTPFFRPLGQRLGTEVRREEQIRHLSSALIAREEMSQSLHERLAALDEEWHTRYQTLLKKWGSQQKRMADEHSAAIESLSSAIQSLSATLSEERESHQRLVHESALQADQLRRILASRAWRWVTRYGRLKAALLTPLNRLRPARHTRSTDHG